MNEWKEGREGVLTEKSVYKGLEGEKAAKDEHGLVLVGRG